MIEQLKASNFLYYILIFSWIMLFFQDTYDVVHLSLLCSIWISLAIMDGARIISATILYKKENQSTSIQWTYTTPGEKDSKK